MVTETHIISEPYSENGICEKFNQIRIDTNREIDSAMPILESQPVKMERFGISDGLNFGDKYEAN